MRILILGRDGCLGWPTALHLSAVGHRLPLADNAAPTWLRLRDGRIEPYPD